MCWYSFVVVVDHIDEGGGQYIGGGHIATAEAGQVYDDDEIRQYHRDIQNHYAQQTLGAHHPGLAQQQQQQQQPQSVIHPPFPHPQTSDVHSVASSSGKFEVLATCTSNLLLSFNVLILKLKHSLCSLKMLNMKTNGSVQTIFYS